MPVHPFPIKTWGLPNKMLHCARRSPPYHCLILGILPRILLPALPTVLRNKLTDPIQWHKQLNRWPLDKGKWTLGLLLEALGFLVEALQWNQGIDCGPQSKPATGKQPRKTTLMKQTKANQSLRPMLMLFRQMKGECSTNIQQNSRRLPPIQMLKWNRRGHCLRQLVCPIYRTSSGLHSSVGF